MGKNNYQKKEVRRTEEGLYICDRCGEYFEEQDMTRGRYGIIGICKSCTGKAHSEGAKNRKNKQDAMKREIQELRIEVADLQRQLRERDDKTLEHVSGLDLILELKRRGYEGNITIVQRKTVDLTKFE